MKKFMILFVATLFICSCGSKGGGGTAPAPAKDTKVTEPEVDPTATTTVAKGTKTEKHVVFKCHTYRCDTGKQFCLESDDLGVVLTAECVDYPIEDYSCDLAMVKAKEMFSNYNNCSGEVHCSTKNSQMKVSCHVPHNN